MPNCGTLCHKPYSEATKACESDLISAAEKATCRTLAMKQHQTCMAICKPTAEPKGFPWGIVVASTLTLGVVLIFSGTLNK